MQLEEDPEQGLMAFNITKEERSKLVRQQQGQQGDPAASGVGSLHSRQFVLPMDMAIWKDMCRVVPGGRGLMPHRPRHAG